MSDSTDPRQTGLPALSPRSVSDGIESVELDESLKYRSDTPRDEPIRRRSRSRWIVLAVLSGTVAFAYIAFFHTEKPIVSSDAVPAGWDDLGECATMTSVDGQRRLALSSDHTAELMDRSEQHVLTAVGFKPTAVQVLGHVPELHDEVGRQVYWRDFATLLPRVLE
jgi:hypothetical protein